MIDFSAIGGVISDMDGVLWRGDEALPGLARFVDFLAERGTGLVLATNNSSKSAEEYVAKLNRLGVTGIAPGQIVTSRIATQDHLHRNYAPGTPFYAIGSPGLVRSIEEAGFAFDPAAARFVVVGIDTSFTYEKLTIAADLIRAGADFIGTNGDLVIPHGAGFAPGNGSILAAIAAASGRQPITIGKPGRPMFEAARAVLGTPAAATLMIGDRLDTDIAGASAAGLRSGLMLTGVATMEHLEQWEGALPDGVFRDLPHLVAAWTGA